MNLMGLRKIKAAQYLSISMPGQSGLTAPVAVEYHKREQEALWSRSSHGGSIMPMTSWLRNSSAGLLLLLVYCPTFLHAQARRAIGTVESAVDVLKDSASIPEKGIPQELLREAEAV